MKVTGLSVLSPTASSGSVGVDVYDYRLTGQNETVGGGGGGGRLGESSMRSLLVLLCLPVCLFVRLSLTLLFSLCVSVSASLCLCLCLSLCLCLCLSLSLSTKAVRALQVVSPGRRVVTACL